MKKIMLFPLLCMYLMSSAQPQKVFMDQHTILQFSHSKELKGKFLFEDESGTAYYECKKPLLGFTTYIVQSSGTGKTIIKALPNKLAPLQPMLEKVLDQLNRTADILGIIKKDSNSDAPLRDYLQKYPKLERIVVYADKSGAPATNFAIYKNGGYMLDIIPVD